jgi:hypothetical protein
LACFCLDALQCVEWRWPYTRDFLVAYALVLSGQDANVRRQIYKLKASHPHLLQSFIKERCFQFELAVEQRLGAALDDALEHGTRETVEIISAMILHFEFFVAPGRWKDVSERVSPEMQARCLRAVLA